MIKLTEDKLWSLSIIASSVCSYIHGKPIGLQYSVYAPIKSVFLPIQVYTVPELCFESALKCVINLTCLLVVAGYNVGSPWLGRSGRHEWECSYSLFFCSGCGRFSHCCVYLPFPSVWPKVNHCIIIMCYCHHLKDT